jgi:hypothetical protein
MRNTIHIAQSFTDDAYAADTPIMAGDTPPLATRDVLIPLALAAIPQYTPLSYDATTTNAYKPWAAGEDIVALSMYDIPDSAADQRAAVATAGMFNIDAVNWPAGTTEDEVAAATVNSQVQFRKLLYSDKRVDKSGLLVGEDYEAPAAG